MINPQQITSVIFDFDGTLCFSRYFEPLGQESLKAVGSLVFGDNSSRWADPWMKGDLTCQHIAAYLSEHLPESEEDILAALREGCSSMTLNPVVLDFAIQQPKAKRKTALVTANMDVFTEIVVPSHKLDTVFDLVLNTSDHRTLDKSILWKKALAIFGPEYSFETSLLIDDSPRMITMFRALGGYTYQYEGEQLFAAWLEETGFTEKIKHRV